MDIFFKKLIEQVKEKNLKTDKEILKLRDELCKIYTPKQFPSLIQILLYLKNKNLKIKPQRTLSGVAPIAVMTKPIACKHGKCIYCPGGPKSIFGNIPQSYTGKEPAALRAIRNKFDPYLQIFNRLEQYTLLNQIPEKVELIVMGGTFPSFNKIYQEQFITYCFKALNDFSSLFYKNKFNFKKFNDFFELPSEDIHDKSRINHLHEKILKLKAKSSLEKEQKRNETSKIKDIALCIETRPDYCKKIHINQMLKLGTTRVELGVQTVYNDILKKINRAHSLQDSIAATQLLKDSFLKCCYHIMLDLPYSTDEKDVLMFKELFSNPDFKPDALKIYPCLVLPGTRLYKLWKLGKFKPMTTEKIAEIILEVKKYIPEYCRIHRINRDIPTKVTTAGIDRTNLRQYVHELMQEKNIKCNCIRCREPKNNAINIEKIKILKQEYQANNGTEIFLSAEDTKNDLLLGFLRLRIPYKPFRKEITKNSAGIRELHVYGPLTQLGKKGIIQHQGLGKKLLLEAENISKDYDIKKLLVISGIGAKEYYKRLGYKKDGVYMSKIIY